MLHRCKSDDVATAIVLSFTREAVKCRKAEQTMHCHQRDVEKDLTLMKQAKCTLRGCLARLAGPKIGGYAASQRATAAGLMRIRRLNCQIVQGGVL